MSANRRLAIAQASTWHMSADVAAIWRQAEPLGQRCTFLKDQVIIRQGDPGTAFYFIREGLVQTSAVFPDGSAFVFEMLKTNGMFGDSASLADMPYMNSVVALQKCELLRFNIHTVKAALPEQPEIAQALLQVLAQRQYVLAQRLLLLSHTDSEVVVGGLLAGLAQLQDGADGDPSGTASIALTHEQIASMTGLTRVTVSRTIKRLRERGLIRTEQNCIQVINPDQLIHLTGEVPLPGRRTLPGIRVRCTDLPENLRPTGPAPLPYQGPDRRNPTVS